MSKKAVIDIQYPIQQDLETSPVFVFNYDQKMIELDKECTLSDVDLSTIESFLINLPISLLNFRIITCPDLERRKIREIIPLELEGSILTKKEDLIFDFISEKVKDGSLKVLVAYIDKSSITKVLDLLKEKGIVHSAMLCCQFKKSLSQNLDDFANNLFNIKENTKEEKVNLIIEELQSPTIRLTDKELSLTKLKDTIFKPLYKLSILILIFLIVTSLWLSFGIFTDMTQKSALIKEIKTNYMNLFPDDKKISDELYQIKSRLKVLKDKEEAIIGLRGLDILKRLSEAKKEGIVLNEVILERNNLKIKGDATSMEELEKFKKELSWLKGINISNVNQTEKGFFTFNASGIMSNEF